MKSQLPLRSAATRVKAKTLDHSEIIVSSKGRDWVGIYFEGGINEGWVADDLTVDGHYVALEVIVAHQILSHIRKRLYPTRLFSGQAVVGKESRI